MKHPAQGRRDGGSSGCESACAQDHQAGARPATGSARPRARTGRSGKHERERGLCDGITVIPSHRGRPVRDVPGRTGQPAAHGARRRTPARREPVARADGARPRFGNTPDRGPPSSGTAAPACAHETGHRPLVLIVDCFGAHPLRARPAYRGLLPRRASPARLADPLVAAAPASSPCPGHRKPATRTRRFQASLIPREPRWWHMACLRPVALIMQLTQAEMSKLSAHIHVRSRIVTHTLSTFRPADCLVRQQPASFSR